MFRRLKNGDSQSVRFIREYSRGVVERDDTRRSRWAGEQPSNGVSRTNWYRIS